MPLRVLATMTPSAGAVTACWMMFTVLVWRSTGMPVPAAESSSAAAQCSPQTKNPCETFPTLCSAGGGLCVTKNPCEYQCQCPDGRVARDCSKSSNPDPGSVVDSLLIFPKDMFVDVNHASKTEAFAKLNRSNSENGTAATTAEPKTSTGLTITTAGAWAETTISSQEPTKTAASGLSNNNLPLSPSLTTSKTPVLVPTATTPDSNGSVKSTFTTAVPSHAIASVGPLVSESSTIITRYQTSGNNSNTFTGKPTDAPLEQSTITTLKEVRVPLSKVSLLPNLPSTPDGSTQRTTSTEPPQPVLAGSPSKTPIEAKTPLEPNIPLEPKIPLEAKIPLEPKIPIEPKTTQEPKTPLEPKSPLEPKTPLEPKSPIESKSPLEPKTPLESKAGPAQAVKSLKQEMLNSNPADTIRTTIKHNVILSHDFTPGSASTTTTQLQEKTTQQYHISPKTPGTNPPSPSTQHTGATSQQTSTNVSTTLSTAATEEFPTLFKLTLDNPMNPIDSGKNSALSVVVHRVFLPIEAFQTAVKKII